MAARNRARTHLFGLSWPLATVLLSAVLLAACSSGPPPPAPAPPPTAVVPTEEAADVCGAAVDALGVLSDGPEIGDQPLPPEQLTAAFAEYRARLEPPLAAVEQNPPPAVRQDVATLARQARFAIENRDVAAVRTPEFEGATDRLQAYVVRDCGYPQVQVIATNYAYQGVPATAGTGITVVNLVNQGTEPHELVLYRINDGVSQPMAELARLPEEKRNQAMRDVTYANANPGSADTVFASLIPGRYGMACFQLRGATPLQPGTGPSHSELGMVAEFTVP